MERRTDRVILSAVAPAGILLVWLGFEGDGAAVLFGVVVVLGVLLLLWPNSWANLTSFQMPTDEFTRKVETNVVIPAKAWSTLGKTWPNIVSDAFAVANVAVYRDQTSKLGRDVKNVAGWVIEYHRCLRNAGRRGWL